MPVPLRVSCIYEEVDSETLPAADRFALWRETGRLPMAAEPADADGRRRFRIRVNKMSGPSGRFADLSATPMKLNREASHYSRDGLDMVSLTLMLGPTVQHQFGPAGRSAILPSGQILVKDFTRPATAWWQTPSRSLNLHLPRLTVEAAVGSRVHQLHGRVLSPEGLSPMLHAQLFTLAHIAPRVRNAARAAALDATVDLATAVLRCELGGGLEDAANNPGLFAAAQVFISRHLASHRLSPGLIARHLRCSRAHLYRVFAAQGETVAHYMREQRLRRAHDLLFGSNDSTVRIGDIAFRCGFEDPVHFTRLFRQRFGLTPSALRAGESRSSA
jgi:AraC-like DNA-binding protein